jgi:hypothetical protein
MGGKKVMWVVAVGVLCRAGAALASTSACAVDARVAAPEERAVGSDRSGALIDVRRGTAGRLIVELKDRNVSVRREFIRGASTTILRSGSRQLSIRLSPNDMMVIDGDKTISGSLLVKDSLEEPVKYLRESSVVRAARALLDRSTLNADSFDGNALLLTRALLAAVTGDSTPTREYQSWAAAKIKEPRVVRAQAKGPGQCWDMYAAEAMRIINDYIDCANSCNWSGWFCMSACGFLYDIRAEAAFMWFIDCSGGFFVAG